MKIAISGASGLLGSSLLEEASRRGISCIPIPRSLLHCQSDLEARKEFREVTHIIHAAANTNVEACEINPDDCYRDNFFLTQSLIHGPIGRGRHVTFISSTGVYGSAHREPFREYEQPNPPTHHHRSKLLSEASVMESSPMNLVIRTGWLFGGRIENPKNFVARRIEEAKLALASGRALHSNSEQLGVPSFTNEVAKRIILLIQLKAFGVFNCVNEGRATRQEYVSEIVRLANIDVSVAAASAASFNRKAQVSNNESALNWRADCLGLPKMPTWQHSLAAYISEIDRDFRV